MASSDPKDVSALLLRIDELYKANDNQAIYDQLKPLADNKVVEVLWRLARSTYNLAQSAEASKQKEKYTEAFEYAKTALELDDKHFACHKWYAILLDEVSGQEGTKKRIESAYVVKEHFQKATELNPRDATSQHTLGVWHFLFADLPWYQRTIAAAIFASPPTATYEEALGFFLKAEEIDPGFYTMNLMMLGKTYTRLKNKDDAVKYLKKVLEFPVKTVDDKKANDEARELLKGHGIKV